MKDRAKIFIGTVITGALLLSGREYAVSRCHPAQYPGPFIDWQSYTFALPGNITLQLTFNGREGEEAYRHTKAEEIFIRKDGRMQPLFQFQYWHDERDIFKPTFPAVFQVNIR